MTIFPVVLFCDVRCIFNMLYLLENYNRTRYEGLHENMFCRVNQKSKPNSGQFHVFVVLNSLGMEMVSLILYFCWCAHWAYFLSLSFLLPVGHNVKGNLSNIKQLKSHLRVEKRVELFSLHCFL